jgi:hypothetical protein
VVGIGKGMIGGPAMVKFNPTESTDPLHYIAKKYTIIGLYPVHHRGTLGPRRREKLSQKASQRR